MAQDRKRGESCDPLDGRLGFKHGGLAGPALELNSRVNENSHSQNRRKRPRAASAGQWVRGIWNSP